MSARLVGMNLAGNPPTIPLSTLSFRPCGRRKQGPLADNESMKRRTRPVPFARMRPDTVLRDLAVVPMAEWPRHLRLARNILSAELSLDDAKAQAVLIASFRASHACAQAINQRTRDIADFAACLKFRHPSSWKLFIAFAGWLWLATSLSAQRDEQCACCRRLKRANLGIGPTGFRASDRNSLMAKRCRAKSRMRISESQRALLVVCLAQS
jgi:hypothetical protein